MPQNNKIKIRRGLNAALPAANTEVGELRYSTDSKELFIDDGSTNVKIGGNPADFPISTATKSYVDTADALKVNKAGDTMTGRLGNATSNLSTSNTRGGKEILFGATAVGNFGVLNNTDGIEAFNVMSDGSGIRLGTSTGVAYLKGTGFPNGVVSAPVGSIYIDTAVTNGASSWIKKSGTGNTGWQVLEGDTGWRAVTPINGWTVNSIQMRRLNNNVSIKVEGLAASTMTDARPYSLPSGFQYGTGSSPRGLLHTTATPAVAYRYFVDGSVNISSATTSTPTLYGQIDFTTTQNWPTTLPGTAA